MISRRIHRHLPDIQVGGAPIVLVCESWTLTVGGSRAGAGLTYHRPAGIEVAGELTELRDHVMLVRLAALAVLALTALARRVR